MGDNAGATEDASRIADRTAPEAGQATARPAKTAASPRRSILLTMLGTSLVWLAVLSFFVFARGRPEPVTFQIQPPPATATPMPTATPAPLWVDVGGAVRSPGLYQVTVGARVQDALAAAGGLAANADVQALSLARPVVDGEKLHVPAVGEAAPVEPTLVSRGGEAALDLAPPASNTATGPLININTATLAELDTLPGIGPKTAQAILDYRQANGPFLSVEDLLEVKGIGEATLAGLRDLVTVK